LEYSTLMLLEDLREGIAEFILSKYLYRGKLSNEKLSKILGQKINHITTMFSNARKKSSYIIILPTLECYKDNLREKFGSKSDKLINLINYYIKVNSPPNSNLKKVKLFHPDLIEDYFRVIDTKEKAYWLGFIYADGSIYKAYEKDDFTRFGIKIARKDKILVYRFAHAIGFNKKYIVKYNRKRVRDDKLKIYKMIKMELKSKEFTSYLKSLGVIPNKTFHIKLPNLDSREFDVAFLLGFFDGDGREGTTNLRSGNKMFLEQIKKKYDLLFDVYPDKDNPNAFTLSFGARLFNEMMSNYAESLQRKRKTFNVNKFITQELTEKKMNELVLKMPAHVIARIFGLSQSSITRLLQKYNIKLPPKSYWIDRDYPGKENESSFKEFYEFFTMNPNEQLSFYYKAFPFNAKSVIRSWIYKLERN
jgi:hypothetical protein